MCGCEGGCPHYLFLKNECSPLTAFTYCVADSAGNSKFILLAIELINRCCKFGKADDSGV